MPTAHAAREILYKIHEPAWPACRTKWSSRLYSTDVKKITHITRWRAPSLNASGSIVSIGLSDNILEQ